VKFVEVCETNDTPHAVLFCKQQGNRYCSVQALIMLTGRSLRVVWGSVLLSRPVIIYVRTDGMETESPNRGFVNKKQTNNHQNTTL
jgi:hypothetical protein